MLDYLMIGTVLKPQGVRGECKIRPWASDISKFSDWHTLYLRDGDAFAPVAFEAVRIHDGFIYGRLNHCASADDAEAFRGKELYIDRSSASQPEPGADLIGCDAVDENGTVVGRLTEVLQYGTVDTWVFRTAEGTMMAPALLSVFPETDVRNRRISVLSDKLREVAVFDR